jgi:hypothetical protein
MIQADVVVDSQGLLRSCSISGHAGAGKRGGDVVCAAVSVLSRTALKLLSEAQGVRARGNAPERGVLTITVECDPGGIAFLGAVTSFLIEGLSSVAVEYPSHCSLRIETERRI